MAHKEFYAPPDTGKTLENRPGLKGGGWHKTCCPCGGDWRLEMRRLQKDSVAASLKSDRKRAKNEDFLRRSPMRPV